MAQRLDFKNLNKHITLQNLSVYYTWENIRQQYKNNKLIIIASALNDEFELPDDSYSVPDIQDYTECIVKKKHETLTTVPSLHKLELQSPETMKLFGGSAKN